MTRYYVSFHAGPENRLLLQDFDSATARAIFIISVLALGAHDIKEWEAL